MRKNFKNSISIKSRALLESPSVEILMILSFLICMTFCVWPEIMHYVFHREYLLNNALMIQITVVIFCTLLVFILTMMVVRIGAQVGFEKGNKVTEIILTSITGRELYKAHLVSGSIVLVILLFTMCIPVGICLGLHTETSIIFSSVNVWQVLFILVHIIFVSCFYIAISIALTSKVKRSEDTGLYLVLLMIPNMVSQLYFFLQGGLFSGVLYWMNYFPLFSMITSLGGTIRNMIAYPEYFGILASDILFLFVSILLCEKIYEKNIIKN